MATKEQQQQQQQINEKKNAAVFDTNTALSREGATLSQEIFSRVNEGEASERARFLSKEDARSLTDIISVQMSQYEEKDLPADELAKKKQDMMDAFLEFEVIQYEETDAKRAERRRETVLARENKAKSFREPVPATLFTSSKEQKKRVLKSMKMDRLIKDSLIKEETSLEEIIQGHVTEEKRREAAKEGKKFLGIFRDAKEAFNENPLLSREERARRLFRMAKPFESAIVMYKEEYFTTLTESNRQKEIETLLDRITRFYDLFSDTSDDSLEAVTKREALLEEMGILRNSSFYDTEETEDDVVIITEKEDTLERLNKRTHEIDMAEERDYKAYLDDNLTEEQIAGVESVDRFLIANMHTSGGNEAYMDKLLRLPMRDRLMIYGLVEKGREAAPSAQDVAFTQIAYTPSVLSFANAVSRIPGFLWKGNKRQTVARALTNIRWEKIEAALEHLNEPEVQEIKTTFSRLQGVEDSGLSYTEEKAQEIMGDNADITEEDGKIALLKEEEKKAIELSLKLTDRESKRNAQLVKVIDVLEKSRDAMEIADKAIINKKTKRAAADELNNKAKEEIEKLENADRELLSAIHEVQKMAEVNEDLLYIHPSLATDEELDQEIKPGEKKEPLAKKAVSGGILVGSQISLLLSKVDKMVIIQSGEESAPLSASLTSGSFATVTGALGLLGGLMGTLKLISSIKKNGGALAWTDMGNSILKNGKDLLGASWGVAAGGLQIHLAKMGEVAAKLKAVNDLAGAQAVKDAIDLGSDAVKFTTVAVNGVKICVDLVDTGVQIKHAVHHGVASWRVHKLKKNGTLTGDEAAYADNILRIDRRNKEREAVQTANSILVNGAGIVATLLGGPLGAVLYAGASITDKLLMMGLMKGWKKVDMNRMIDEFLQLDKTAATVIPGYRKLKFWNVQKKKKIKAYLRSQMAAELGYVTDKGLSRHIISNYANFIYRKLFFVDDDMTKPLTQKNDKDKTLTPVSYASYQMVKSLGLRVTFPKDENDENRQPTPELIAAKLGG